ncbi:hypothetical protein B6S44_12135 [Bosea sp. Tri-44]|uniref:DUF1127 domain-containing protein n=1 Tax=Bosea sp. Tri-44 TaxID=1972137 RepID=UPI00100F78A0|nr:DUF1127 domain-containing protein [Bosea sp. Tri-44]RXT55031.1 hypothetical protein B6S44_12135 [Bosea sp. Tri-44]
MISFIIGSAKPVLAMVDGLGRILGGISRWLQSRRDYRTLCDMTERDLRDLGLRDSDLRDATAAPFFGDPTGIISLRVEERRGLAGGESVDQVLRGLSAGAPVRPERIAKESDSAVSSRVVFLRAAE